MLCRIDKANNANQWCTSSSYYLLKPDCRNTPTMPHVLRYMQCLFAVISLSNVRKLKKMSQTCSREEFRVFQLALRRIGLSGTKRGWRCSGGAAGCRLLSLSASLCRVGGLQVAWVLKSWLNLPAWTPPWWPPSHLQESGC